MAAPTYSLTTLQDVYDQVPADRIKACMDEIAESMRYAKELGVLVGEPLQWVSPCTWTDDGKESQTIELVSAETGETAALVFEAKR